MENTEFVEKCKVLPVGQSLIYSSLTYEELFNLVYPAECFVPGGYRWKMLWGSFQIHAVTKKDIVFTDWDGKHTSESNITTRSCQAGTKVRIWMVSRMGDIGITDNLIDAYGYDARGIEDGDLENFEVKKIRDITNILNEKIL